MKKILFLFTFFFLLSPLSVSAQTNSIPKDNCEALQNGTGICNTFVDGCESNQKKEGMCSLGVINLGACCTWKEPVGTIDPNQQDDTLNDGSMLRIGTNNCTKTRSSGGWGGRCGTVCNNSGQDRETVAGICNEVERTECCVPFGTALKNPTRSQVLGPLVTTNYCESGMKGSCEDIDDTIISEFIDGKEATCDDTNQVVAALCTDNSSWSLDGNDVANGCCVPKDGEYCQALKAIEGADICAGASVGAGGGVIPFEYGDYKLLEQIPGSSNTSGKLEPYLESIYKAGLVLIVIGAIFMISVGGFLYMSSAGNTSMIKKGKGMITDAIIGLVVALIIWLILNIINPDLVNLKIDPLPGLTFQSVESGEGTDGGTSGGGSGGGSTGSFAAKLYSGSDLFSDTGARSFFTANNVKVNKSDCGSASQTDCTSLGEFPRYMASVAVAIKNDCNCEVVITGGTEAGHSTHGKGRAAMDMRKTAALDNYFKKFSKVGASSNGNPIYQYLRVKVWFEDGEHYHIWEPAN